MLQKYIVLWHMDYFPPSPFHFSSSFVLGSPWDAQKIKEKWKGEGGKRAEGGRAKNTYILKMHIVLCFSNT